MSDTATKPRAEAASRVSQLPARSSFKKISDCANLKEAFDSSELRSLISDAIPNFMNADSMLRTWVQAASKSPLIYQADMRQALGAFQSLAYLGLVPNTPLGHAHIIPFKTRRWNPQTRKRDIEAVDLQVIIGYPGYIDLGSRSGAIKALHCDVVHDRELEQFSARYGTNQGLYHDNPKPRGFIPDGDPELAYAWIKTEHGDMFEVMSWHEVVQIRNRSQAYRTALASRESAESEGKKIPPAWKEAPWVRDAAEMGKKTALRRLVKWIPKCPEIRAASELEDAQERSRLDFGPVIDGKANPLEGGVPEIDDDEPEPSANPSAAFSRKEDRPSQQQPRQDQGQDQPRQQQAATQTQSRQAQQKPSGRVYDVDGQGTPTPTGQQAQPPATKPETKPQEPAFEGWILDEVGEATERMEPYDHPVEFAKAVEAMWQTSQNREALIENNKDTLEWAAELHPQAKAIFDSLTGEGEAGGEQGSETKPQGIQIVEVPEGRGGWSAYEANFKAGLATVSADQLNAWVEAQAPYVARAAAPIRARIAAAIFGRSRELSIQVPTAVQTFYGNKPQAKPEESSPDQGGPNSEPPEQPADPDAAKRAHELDQATKFVDGFVADVGLAAKQSSAANGYDAIRVYLGNVATQRGIGRISANKTYKEAGLYNRILDACANEPAFFEVARELQVNYEQFVEDVNNRKLSIDAGC